MSPLAPEQTELLRALARHGVEFVVMGGVAAQVHGWRGATADLRDRARGRTARRRGRRRAHQPRSSAPADFRFINIAGWSSPLMFARALKRPEFTGAAAAMPFPSHPALYTPA